MTKIAIITVVRDDMPGLAVTAASIAAQTMPPAYWVIQEGGMGAEPDVSACPVLWERVADDGIYDAMNRASLRLPAECAWVLYLNAGDILADSGVLARLAAALAALPDAVSVAYGDAEEVGADGRLYLKPARSPTSLWRGMPTHHQAMLFRIDALPLPVYDTAWRIAADWALLLRQSRDGAIARLDGVVCRFAPAGESARLARLGRVEQAKIRQEMLTWPRWRAETYRAFQSLLWRLRIWFPAVFWRIRARRLTEICQ